MALISPSYNTQRMPLGTKLPLNTPLSVILDISERCNFRCGYCFRSGPKDESWSYTRADDLMSWDVFERATAQLGQFSQKIKNISLSGHGEPLCNPRIVDMARHLKEAGVTECIEMHTNASLLTEQNVESIAKAGFTKIVVSLQGLDSPAYERVCKARIDWKRFYNNLRLLCEHKVDNTKVHIKISEKALDHAHNQDDENKFYALFDDMADSIFVEKVVPLWRNVNVDSDLTENKFGVDFGEINFCSLVFYKLMIIPNGDIYPCTGLPAPASLGNICELSIQDAWNSDERRKFLLEHLRLTRHQHTPCAGCFVPVNSIMSPEDIIDNYRDEIMERVKGTRER